MKFFISWSGGRSHQLAQCNFPLSHRPKQSD